jgi:hypothetical protein
VTARPKQASWRRAAYSTCFQAGFRLAVAAFFLHTDELDIRDFRLIPRWVEIR